MTRRQILAELEKLASGLGARVIYDDLNFPGGYCRGRGQLYIIIDERLALDRKIQILCSCVSQLAWEEVPVPSEVARLLVAKQASDERSTCPKSDVQG